MLCYAKSLQSCPTLCDPIDGSPPGFPVPGILQARTLEWVAISFSNAWKWKVKVKSLSRVRLLATPWTAAYQAPPSMRFFQARVLEWGAIAFSAFSLSWGIKFLDVTTGVAVLSKVWLGGEARDLPVHLSILASTTWVARLPAPSFPREDLPSPDTSWHSRWAPFLLFPLRPGRESEM